MTIKRSLFSAICATLLAGNASAATITIVNLDGPNEGFNDPTPVAALPSNPFTTLGEQRLHVFQTAANQWGALLVSNIEIRVQAAFNPLTCSGTSAVLGSAGGTTLHQNFANAPVANVWYSSSLASSLANVDINGPGSNDINSQFNVDIDNGTCLTGTAGWYYSTLASDTTPAGRIPLLPVVFHELAHGLGFQTFTNSSTGAFTSGVPSIWDLFLADAVTGTTWNNMASNAVRQASAISDPNLIWKGPIVTAEQANFLGPAPALIVTAPAAIAGEKTQFDLWAVDLDDPDHPRVVRQTPGTELGAALSPDEKWFVFSSDESGTAQSYLAPWPAMAPLVQLSVKSGTRVAWTKGGREVVYQQINGTLTAVAVDIVDGRPRIGRPQELFVIGPPDMDACNWSVSADGERFVVIDAKETAVPRHVNLVLGWPEILRPE